MICNWEEIRIEVEKQLHSNTKVFIFGKLVWLVHCGSVKFGSGHCHSAWMVKSLVCINSKVFCHCVVMSQYTIERYTEYYYTISVAEWYDTICYAEWYDTIHCAKWYCVLSRKWYCTYAKWYDDWWGKQESLLQLVFAAQVFILACTL